jgi:hypothetical protein
MEDEVVLLGCTDVTVDDSANAPAQVYEWLSGVLVVRCVGYKSMIPFKKESIVYIPEDTSMQLTANGGIGLVRK